MHFIYAIFILFISTTSLASNRLKDIVDIKGVRDNPLVGYGLVIGLNGTGDGGGEITNNSLKKMFQTLGLDPVQEVSSNNVAAVIVTAKLPAFGRIGQKLDVTVSSIGDAKSLAGGTLLVTPLKGGDGNIYAVASGSLSIGGLKQGANYATSASIPNGATVEKEVEVAFHKKKSIRMSLKSPDFTTAARVVKTINENLGGKFATASDSATVDLIIPPHYQRNVVNLVAIVENYRVNQDNKAKIIINEKTGTIVAGGDIRLNQVAISHGDLMLEIGNDGEKLNKPGSLFLVEKKTTLKDLVNALNAIGTSSEDLISIFQALKRNGALFAELEFI
ncbi:MAG: flagellar basal body P-ring protein FlgI [Bacteriovoracaceae bacterium]|jgi:flagellar P-ring protein precursor FlgI|nr:flagellar biosynthesis protein FlgA [Halobacteriovoraceae bacterium]MDP7321799.1 flagellar basal body P-ring protein FlgI [Bacteriovoracaceae bacterium]|tara:strand:- start:143 stop:1141 length:999 start_codon:yes stop_codon:yes gene_type:complete